MLFSFSPLYIDLIIPRLPTVIDVSQCYTEILNLAAVGKLEHELCHANDIPGELNAKINTLLSKIATNYPKAAWLCK